MVRTQLWHIFLLCDHCCVNWHVHQIHFSRCHHHHLHFLYNALPILKFVYPCLVHAYFNTCYISGSLEVWPEYCDLKLWKHWFNHFWASPSHCMASVDCVWYVHHILVYIIRACLCTAEIMPLQTICSLMGMARRWSASRKKQKWLVTSWHLYYVTRVPFLCNVHTIAELCYPSPLCRRTVEMPNTTDC